MQEILWDSAICFINLLMYVPRGCLPYMAIFMVFAMIYEMVFGNMEVSTGLGLIAFFVVAGFLAL